MGDDDSDWQGPDEPCSPIYHLVLNQTWHPLCIPVLTYCGDREYLEEYGHSLGCQSQHGTLYRLCL